MKKYEETLQINMNYPIKAIAENVSKPLVFDIETTGLSPANSQLYMIAALALFDDGCKFTQWFADDLSSEQEVLKDFFEYVLDFDALIHFNGDTFDIPFLDKCALSYHILSPLRDMTSIDVYKLIKPYRKILGCERLNQKSIEVFTGLNRDDKYSGGDLIAVYEEYISTHDDSLLDMLKLHNREDVLGLVHILSMLSYRDCFNGLFDCTSTSIDKNVITFSCQLYHELPSSIHTSLSPITIDANHKSLKISIALFSGTLKHFFDDYKNYVFLPAEDMAVYKSVGDFVSRDAKVKATAKTAYIKKDGNFIPVFGITDKPVFYESYKSAPRYMLLDDIDIDNPNICKSYIMSTLSYLGLS